MQLPLILLNFKNYRESFGENGIKLAKICDSVAKEYGLNIAIAPQYTDVKDVRSFTNLNLFAQHIDPVEPGAFTGHIVAENLKELGISGTLINHAEKQLETNKIEKCIMIAKKLHLTTVCCAATPPEAAQIAKFSPDFIAIEHPDLIGTGISISKARPEVITEGVYEIKKSNPKVNVLCGAGITAGEDLKKALELGASGILVSSYFVKSKDPQSFLLDFVKNV